MKALKVFFCVLIILFISSQTLHAQTAPAPEGWVAQLVSVEGSAQLKKAGEAKWAQARLYDKLYPGDMLRVMDKSRAAVVMINQSNVRLDENTTLTFKGVEEEKTILLDIFRGAAHFFNRVTRTLKIFTPYVNGIVQGTEFLVKVDDKEALISIFEGRIAAENDKGSIIVNGGQTVIAKAGQAPMLMVVVKPRDAVQWALYYPSIMDFRPEDFSGTADWQDKTRKSVEAYRKGDLAGANEGLKDLQDEGLTDTRYLTYRATLALSVGRLEEASAYLERTVKVEPNNANAYALQSVIAVVQNRKDDATNLARKATSLDPKSPTALIAQSYAQQARFDINGATASVQEAVKNSPNDAYARARLAELWLSQGYLDRALEEANRAVSINANIARTQIVLGYAYLTQVNIKEAIDAFEKSITLNSADPLARLGLGLAKIRKGDLEEGRKDIEIAASLDVNNSLVRSYLGKAYYEEKRDKLSKDQFQIAKQLDPMDPTPWFYDAILKQSVNRPVEALQDMQKSIELNNNRAVYRSQLLLDEDLAARSAGVGRIYNDLGFQQRALVEGWKSLNVDPGNYSAHRFLSDSYISLPRHEIARVSELLQSQLRQPININPVQPQLAESSSSILQGSGPSSSGFNEYDSLFNRNRAALVANGVWGQNSTLGDEVTVSGVYDRLSISAGQMFYKTDGIRENNDLQKNIYNIYAQLMISPETSVLAEFRYSNDKRGDRFLRFDPTDYYIPRRIETIDRYYRLGLRHAFSPNSDLIAVVTYVSQDWNFRDRVEGMAMLDPTVPIIVPMTMDFRDKADTGAYLIEVQHLLKWSRFKVISGGGYYDSDMKNYSDADITIDGFPLPTDSIFYRTKFDHTNVYSYTLTTFPDNVTWTIGASGDFAHSDVVDREQFNPKFGVTWNPLTSTTVRAAAFRAFKRSLLANQTLEPTQVAGFNQFYDDYTGTETWTYGVALDQAFTKNLFGGIEGTWRNLRVPYQTYDDSYQEIVKKTDWDEEAFRAYLYWAPLNWVSLQGEYMQEHFRRSSDSGIEMFTSILTNKYSLGINFFHPLGFFARLKSTYIDQEGDFQHLSFEPYSGSDNFWVFDAAVGYRLPKRLGIITIEARNFTNQKFHFQDTDPANPQFIPESFIFTRLTLNF